MADSALPPPADLEYKSTKDAVIGYRPAALPIESVTGTALSDSQRETADQVVGSPAQGNAISNPALRGLGDDSGLTTASGGTTEAPTLGSAETAATVTAPSAKRKS